MNKTVIARHTWNLFVFSVKNRYRNTFAGLLWVILQPLITFGIQAYAFKFVIHVDHQNYLMFLLSGLLPWVFLSTTLEMNVGSFINNSFLFKAITVDPLAFLVSQALDNLMIFLLSLCLAGVFLAVIQEMNWMGLLLAFPAMISLFIFTTGLAILFATFQVFLRDLRYVLTFAMSSMYFATPILYPITFVPIEHRKFFELNPFHIMIRPFREALFGEPSIFYSSLAGSFTLALVVFILAAMLYKLRRNEIVLNV